MINKRSQFGNRFLKTDDDVFSENAWDNVIWTTDVEKEITEKIKINSQTKVTEEIKRQHVNGASSFWNAFYEKHENNFFKDRHWLTVEYPELINGDPDRVLRVFEVGCGVGNSIYPLIVENRANGIYIYGCDLSSHAIDLVKSHELYNEDQTCHAFVADVTDENQSFPFPEESLDVITLIFVLSAITPSKMRSVVSRLARFLKPGGLFLFRDYGRCDLAQMRFKTGQCLEDNFYVRGDGTMVYFFTEEEIEDIFTGATEDGVKIEKVQVYTDRRLIVNRAKQSKMYRIWLTGKFRKL